MQEIEIWINEDETEVTCTSPEGAIQQKKNGLLSHNAKLLHKYLAATHEEAMAIYHLRMGYDPYKPVGKPELCPKCRISYYYPKGSSQCPYCSEV